MPGTGEVHLAGARKGFGFPITTRIVLTAYHVVREAVRDKRESDLSYVPEGLAPVPVSEVGRGEDHDVALLHLAFDVATSFKPAHARPKSDWHVDTRWLPDDPRLDGTVDDPARLLPRGQGNVPFVQLLVRQRYSSYKGYSGSPVLDGKDDVIGVLVAQGMAREKGQAPRGASNVLWAVSINTVAELFGLRSEVVMHSARAKVSRDQRNRGQSRPALSWTRHAPFAHEPHSKVVWTNFTSDGHLLVTLGSDGTIRSWDLATDDEAGAPIRPDHEIARVATSGDGSRLAVAGGRHVSVWTLGHGRDLNHAQAAPLADITLSSDGRYLAIAGGTEPSGIWDLSEPRRTPTDLAQYTVRVAFSPDGRHFASRTTATGVSVWRTFEGSIGRRIPIPIGSDSGSSPAGLPVKRLAFSRGGRWLLSLVEEHARAEGFKRDSVWVHDAHTGEFLDRLEHPAEVEDMVSSPDDTLVATAGWDKRARIWSLDGGTEQFVFDCDTYPRQVALGPDASFLAVARLESSSVRVWSWPVDTLEIAEDLPHSHAVNAIAISREGHLAVACGDHATVWSTKR